MKKIILIIWLHFISDFVLQTDYIAINKSKMANVLIGHCLMYSAPFIFFGWLLPLANKYYSMPGNGVGGSLHIVLEECNVKDSDVKFCLKYAKERGDGKGVELAELLLKMSKTQRGKISNLSGEENG